MKINIDWQGQSLGSDLLDVSPDFAPNPIDAKYIYQVARLDKTADAIKLFSEIHWKLSDYGYWFLLGTLWVSYTGWSDLQRWKWLFQSARPKRETSLMKPSEYRLWQSLPDQLTVMRVHRPGEIDWISYTLDIKAAKRFAAARNAKAIDVYEVQRSRALCLFTRRCEAEVLVLDRREANHVETIAVVTEAT